MPDRKTFIGSSDISVIMGINPWKSPLQLYAEKVGDVEPRDLSKVEAVEWGTRLEPVVAKKFSDDNGVKLMAYKKRFTHKKYPYLTCELDRIITGTDQIVEIKTCNAYAKNDWINDDQIPNIYVCQVIWALGISGRMTGHFAVLCGGQRYFERPLKFDPELFDRMVSRAVKFWDMVQNRRPPAAIDLDGNFVNEYYPGKTLDIIDRNDLTELVEAFVRERARRREVDRQTRKLKALIKQHIGDDFGIRVGGYTLTNKPQERYWPDTLRMKEEGLYEKYRKQTKTRILRIKKGVADESVDDKNK